MKSCSMDFSLYAYAVLALVALISGIAKSGVPGLAIIGVVLAPMVLPAKISTGYILPFLIFSDVLAVIYWRKAAVWRYILAVLPAMFAGIVVGYFLMGVIEDAVYAKVLGCLVIFLMTLDWIRRHRHIPVPTNSRALAWLCGFLAGIMTMLANAAGPVMMIYLLAMNISKEEFVGTNAWLYFIVNLIKVPFSIHLGLLTPESFWVNLTMFPAILVGGFVGIFIVRRISGQTFTKLMRALAFLGGVKLLF